MPANYDIDTKAVLGVTATARKSASSYTSEVNTIGSAVRDAMTSVAAAPSVAMSVKQFLTEALDSEFQLVTGHTASAIRGTEDAASAYDDGNFTMVQTAQRHASMSTYPESMPGRGGASPGGSARRAGGEL